MPPRKVITVKKPTTRSKTSAKPSTLDFGPPSTSATKPKGKSLSELSNSFTPFSKKPPSADHGKGKEKATFAAPTSITPDDQLWIDKYPPVMREDLAVHKQKIDQVARWLTDAFDDSNNGRVRKYRRILTLTGPTGSGKTATLKVLAQSMNIEIVEWKNSVDDLARGDDISDRESFISKFHNFLHRATSYSSLAFTTALEPSSSKIASSSSSHDIANPKRLILLEDLPNILHHDTREAFHTALEAFVNTPAPPACPLVIIVSDVGTRGESVDDNDAGWRNRIRNETINARTALPKSLQGSPWVMEIPFNPVAITYMRRSVSALMAKHFSSPEFTHSQQPSKAFVDTVLGNSNGDIRSAIMSLQFACVVNVPGGGTSKSRGKGSTKAPNKAQIAILEQMTQREQALQLFHLLGKLMYNKRFGDDPAEREEEGPPPDIPTLPDHLAQHTRRPSKVDLNVLYADTPVDTSLLTLYVHQNYTQFCNEIEEAEDISEWLCISDSIHGSDMRANHALMPQYGFYTMAGGTLHALPSPVARRSQKTVKPQWFDILRQTQAAEAQVEAIQTWLSSRVIREHESADAISSPNGAWWSKYAVETELGSVLKLGLGRGQAHAGSVDGRSDVAFVRLPFNPQARSSRPVPYAAPTEATSNTAEEEEEEELDEEERNEQDLEQRAAAAGRILAVSAEQDGGELEEDTIDDF